MKKKTTKETFRSCKPFWLIGEIIEDEKGGRLSITQPTNLEIKIIDYKRGWLSLKIKV